MLTPSRSYPGHKLVLSANERKCQISLIPVQVTESQRQFQTASDVNVMSAGVRGRVSQHPRAEMCEYASLSSLHDEVSSTILLNNSPGDINNTNYSLSDNNNSNIGLAISTTPTTVSATSTASGSRASPASRMRPATPRPASRYQEHH